MDPDELAGVVDLFGGLTREELRRAAEDLAARTGRGTGDIDGRIDEALRGYYLVELDRGDETVLAPGPAALPDLPPHGEDLPHMLDADERDLDRAALSRAAEERLRAEAARAVHEGDEDRVRDLLDVCYDLEAWAGVDTDAIRGRLAAALE